MIRIRSKQERDAIGTHPTCNLPKIISNVRYLSLPKCNCFSIDPLEWIGNVQSLCFFYCGQCVPLYCVVSVSPLFRSRCDPYYICGQWLLPPPFIIGHRFVLRHDNFNVTCTYYQTLPCKWMWPCCNPDPYTLLTVAVHSHNRKLLFGNKKTKNARIMMWQYCLLKSWKNIFHCSLKSNIHHRTLWGGQYTLTLVWKDP